MKAAAVANAIILQTEKTFGGAPCVISVGDDPLRKTGKLPWERGNITLELWGMGNRMLIESANSCGTHTVTPKQGGVVVGGGRQGVA